MMLISLYLSSPFQSSRLSWGNWRTFRSCFLLNLLRSLLCFSWLYNLFSKYIDKSLRKAMERQVRTNTPTDSDGLLKNSTHCY